MNQMQQPPDGTGISDQTVHVQNTWENIVPYRNVQALTAYYLGVFSIIPFLGIPLGVVAVILGIAGLKMADAHPERGGRAHAWTGIIAGGVFSVMYMLIILVVLMNRL